MSINFFLQAYVAILGLLLTAAVAAAGTPRYGELAVAALALLYLCLDLREGLSALGRAEAQFTSWAAARDEHGSGSG